MLDAQGIVDKIRKDKDIENYMCSSGSKDFGMSAPKFCSKLEEFVNYEVGPNMETVNFGPRDYVNISRSNGSSNSKTVNMNRGYKDGHSLLGIGLTSICEKGCIMVASSEIARNVESSIYDFVVKVNGNPLLPERYAMKSRLKNGVFVPKFLIDLKKYIESRGEISEDKVRSLMRKDEEKYGVYFANTYVRDIKGEGFSLTPTDSGYDVFCNSEGHTPEDVVYAILHSGGNHIQKKLDACMIVFNNPEKLKRVYRLAA